MRILFVLTLFVLAFAGCAKDESLPPLRSSEGMTMNGSHFVGVAGVPDEFSEAKPVGSAFVGVRWSTPPVARIGGGFAVGASDGHVYLFNAQDSLERTIEFGERSAVDQIIFDTSAVYSLFADGKLIASPMLHQSDRANVITWSDSLDTSVTGAAILAEDALIIPCANGIVALDKSSGKVRWRYSTLLQAVSVAFNSAGHYIVAAFTGDSFDGTDTLIRFGLDGKPLQSIPIHGRITSNIALCGEDDNRIAVASASGSGNAKHIVVQVYDATSAKKLQEHSLPYFANSIGANRKSYITSGFRTTGGESVSGIDAFSIEDTTSLWSRRFTEPVEFPVAVSDGNIYFSLSFESQAIVGAKGLFYALDARNGKTLTEHAVMGAVSGFVPGMPMPDEAGRLMLADRVRPVIYLFNRSAFRRVF